VDKSIVDTTDKSIRNKKKRVHDSALTNFRTVSDIDRSNRMEALDDLKMLAGENHWPAEVVKNRQLEGRPILTINKLPGFADKIVNDTRMNELSIKISPSSLTATPDLAEIYNGLIKAIENDSDADVAYQTALEGAVYSGFGYFRINTSFIEETSFDQEIVFDRIKNNMSVFLDPSRNKHDGSDCKWAFVTEMISRAEYKIRYPKLADVVPITTDSSDEQRYWQSDDRVRVAEYWVKEPKKKLLLLLDDNRTVDGSEWAEVLPQLKQEERPIHFIPPTEEGGQPVQVDGPAPEGSGFPEDVLNRVPQVIKQRVVKSHKVVQYFIDGEKVISGPHDWAGYYIPIIPVWGKEVTIDERTVLRGVIRNAKDPQRMYSYFRTAATETVALAPKAPYIITAEQVEGYEAEWDGANKANRSYLTYNHIAGVAVPQRQVVSQTAIAEITESNISSDEMKATTSIFDASLGAKSNETSGVAIRGRQSQSEVANYTFPDNLRRAKKFAGKVLIDLIPRIYDTYRQVAIINPEDDREFVTINQVVEDKATGGVVIINDLTQGKYAVTVQTGPSFATQREEAAASMMDFIRTAPDSATAIIDLVAEYQNWPGAIKIANRLKKMLLPPGIDDEGPPPPQEPSMDDILKKLKAEGIQLGNQKKKLDIMDKRRDMTNEDDLDDLVKLVKQLGELGILKKGKEKTDE